MDASDPLHLFDNDEHLEDDQNCSLPNHEPGTTASEFNGAFDQNDESEEDGEGQRDEASESRSEPEIRTRRSSAEKVCLNFNPCNSHWDIICRLGPRNAMPHVFWRYDHVIVDVHYSMHLSFEGSKMESQVRVPCPTCYKGNVFSEYRKNFTLTSNVAFNLVCWKPAQVPWSCLV